MSSRVAQLPPAQRLRAESAPPLHLAAQEPKSAAGDAGGDDEKKIRRPRTPFMIFCAERRPALTAENPGLSFGAKAKALGEARCSHAQEARRLRFSTPHLCSRCAFCFSSLRLQHTA